MSSYTLVYFDIRGIVEESRVLFALAGVPYTDKRVEFTEEWPALKKSGRCPFGQLPLLEFGDGRTICQSAAILRFLANEFGFSPSSDYDQARADMINETTKDLKTKVVSWFREKDENRKAEMKSNIFNDYLPQQMEYLEKVLQQNNGGKGYFVGDKITYADIAIFSFFNGHLAGGALEVPNDIKKHSLLVDFYNRVMNEPKILEYLKNRKPNSGSFPY